MPGQMLVVESGVGLDFLGQLESNVELDLVDADFQEQGVKGLGDGKLFGWLV